MEVPFADFRIEITLGLYISLQTLFLRKRFFTFTHQMVIDSGLVGEFF